VHVSHVKYDPDKGFSSSNVDPSWLALLEKRGRHFLQVSPRRSQSAPREEQTVAQTLLPLTNASHVSESMESSFTFPEEKPWVFPSYWPKKRSPAPQTHVVLAPAPSPQSVLPGKSQSTRTSVRRAPLGQDRTLATRPSAIHYQAPSLLADTKDSIRDLRTNVDVALSRSSTEVLSQKSRKGEKASSHVSSRKTLPAHAKNPFMQDHEADGVRAPLPGVSRQGLVLPQSAASSGNATPHNFAVDGIQGPAGPTTDTSTANDGNVCSIYPSSDYDDDDEVTSSVWQTPVASPVVRSVVYCSSDLAVNSESASDSDSLPPLASDDDEEVSSTWQTPEASPIVSPVALCSSASAVDSDSDSDYLPSPQPIRKQLDVKHSYETPQALLHTLSSTTRYVNDPYTTWRSPPTSFVAPDGWLPLATPSVNNNNYNHRPLPKLPQVLARPADPIFQPLHAPLMPPAPFYGLPTQSVPRNLYHINPPLPQDADVAIMADDNSPASHSTSAHRDPVDDVINAMSSEQSRKSLLLRHLNNPLDLLDALQYVRRSLLTKTTITQMRQWLDNVANHDHRSKVIRFMVDLAYQSKHLPLSLFIKGVHVEQADVIAFGGCADVFLGQYRGQTVAVKRLRIHGQQQTLQKVHTVGIFYFRR
jgi:hypothetical protein